MCTCPSKTPKPILNPRWFCLKLLFRFTSKLFPTPSESMDWSMARLPYLSLSPRVCSDSCPLSLRCYLTISSSDTLYSFFLQFPTIRLFSNESALCIRWSKYWSFSICPSNENSGLISFNIDWFYLLKIHRTFKSLLQHHNSETSIHVNVWQNHHNIVK